MRKAAGTQCCLSRAFLSLPTCAPTNTTVTSSCPPLAGILVFLTNELLDLCPRLPLLFVMRFWLVLWPFHYLSRCTCSLHCALYSSRGGLLSLSTPGQRWDHTSVSACSVSCQRLELVYLRLLYISGSPFVLVEDCSWQSRGSIFERFQPS